jgi:HK97 family phage major capsid protein
MKINLRYGNDEAVVSVVEAGTTHEMRFFTAFMASYSESRAKVPLDVRLHLAPELCLRSIDAYEVRHAAASSGAVVRDRASSTDARKAYIAAGLAKVEREREENFELFLRSSEVRAQAVGVDASGGYITPASFADRFTVSLKQFDQLFDVATLVETDKGTACNFPIDDDTGAVSTIVAENAQSLTSSPVVFDTVAFGRCPQHRSGHIIASMELVQDAAYDFSGLLAQNFGRRFARGVGAAFITQLLSDAAVGVTTASPSAITGDEILDLIASVDAAYAMRGAFLMSTATLTALRKLKASTSGDYLLPFGKDAAGRKTLFDFPIYESPSMPAIGATNKSIAFGDLSRFIRRQVRNSLTVKTYVERYATSGQVGYEGFLRVDGKLAKAANAPVPVRLLQCHS